MDLINDINKKGQEWQRQISKWAHGQFSYDTLLKKRLKFWQSILSNEK